jgi:hypothetical protein
MRARTLRQHFTDFMFIMILSNLGQCYPTFSAVTPLPQFNFPGTIYEARLADFAPERLWYACYLLRHDHIALAAPLFQKDLTDHPNDLVAFIGLAQSRSDLWPGWIVKLKQQLQAHPQDTEIQFKLGLLLWYQQTSAVGGNQDTAALDDAQHLLTNAWETSKQPVVGMAMADMAYRTTTARSMSYTIPMTLLKQLAGPTAYHLFEKTRSNGWYGNPPAIRDVPKKNILPLDGVLYTLWALRRSTVGQNAIVNGKLGPILWRPLSAEDQRAAEYFHKWLGATENTPTVKATQAF